MRRISLALTLLGVIAATGCGQSGSDAGSSGNPGIKDGTYSVKIQNGQDETNPLAKATLQIKNGWVTSVPAGIDCGITTHTACSASFATGSTVVLTAVPATGNALLTWGGDCIGNALTCSLDGAADKYVVAIMGVAGSVAHPNFSDPAVHGAEYAKYMAGTAGAFDCKTCHGATLAGQGIAVACTACHYASSANVNATQERCKSCHATSGSYHQTIDKSIWDATKIAAVIDSVTTTGTTSVVAFHLTKNGAAFAPELSALGQKTVYAASFDRATSTFPSDFSYTVTKTGGSYVGTKTSAPFAPETSDAFVYIYVAENPTVIPAEGNYKLYDNVASIGQMFKAPAQSAMWTWTSPVNVSSCEKCHPAPYMKHGYRAGHVDGLPDMVACKACHYDTRTGSDFDWQVLRNEPAVEAAFKALTPAFKWTDTTPVVVGGVTVTPAAIAAKYAYVAKTVNDTHMSHSMEFEYPQSMANCVTCHEGKLNLALGDAKFTGLVCKSCHATTTGAPVQAERAPLLAPAYHNFNWATGNLVEPTGEVACTACHADNIADGSIPGATWLAGDPRLTDGVGPVMFGGEKVPLLKDLHNGGYNKQIYADQAGTKFSTGIGTQLQGVSRTGNVVTLTFHMTGITNPATLIKPTVVGSLYGYGTKDFIVSGHGTSTVDSKRILEFTEGATNNATTRLNVTPLMTMGNTNWTVTVDLTTWAAMLADGSVKRIEVGFLPAIGLDQTKSPDNAATTGTPPVANPNYNPFLAVGGLAVTVDVTGTGAVVVPDASAIGKAIVDPAKCNKCHDALATTFHSPNYGAAGVVGCRLCHVVGSGGSHLEMQSRSIDSYVHSIHSNQYFDIQNVDFADPVAAMFYGDYIGGQYPKFTTLDCESCHNPGTYDVPDQSKSLPGIHSASATLKNKTRNITGIASAVTGPGSRACGGCHRAGFIKADDAAGLARYDSHTGGEFGYRQASVAATPTSPSTLDQIIAKLKGLFL